MYKLNYDLHIHSCASPCGDDDATPANIAGLSKLLELDIVALTDHNTCKNCPAFFEAADEVGIIPVAGMELTTEEEIHTLCLFPELSAAMEFDKYVYERLMPIPNNPEIYGNQIIYDKNDNSIGEIEYCLINATSIGLYDLFNIIKEYNGAIVPAHIERSAFSLISSLGYVPSDFGFSTVEIRSKDAVENLKNLHPYLNECFILHNSDAHSLENISQEGNMINLPFKSANSLIEKLRNPYK